MSTQRRLRQLVSLKLENLPLPDEPLLRLQAAYSALESEQRIASQLVAELLDLTDFREQESRSITTTRPPALDKEEHDIPNKLSLLRSAKRKLRSVQKQSQSLEFLLERLYFDHIGETLAGFRIEGTRAAQLADELFQLQQSHFQASADSSPNDSSQVSIADASTPGLEAAPGTDPQSASTLASFVTIAFGSIRQTLQFLTARLGSTASTLLRTGNLLRSISKHGDAQADMPVPVTMTKKNGADKTAGQVKAGSNWKALKKVSSCRSRFLANRSALECVADELYVVVHPVFGRRQLIIFCRKQETEAERPRRVYERPTKQSTRHRLTTKSRGNRKSCANDASVVRG